MYEFYIITYWFGQIPFGNQILSRILWIMILLITWIVSNCKILDCRFNN